MLKHKKILLDCLLLFCLAIFVTSCATLTYRDIQNNFNIAVQADNLNSVSPQTDPQAVYRGVIDDLTKEKSKIINELDNKLKANAYVLLAISQWRVEEFVAAKKSLIAANDQKFCAPRDKVLIKTIPVLIDEKELMTTYHQTSKLSLEKYKTVNFQKLFINFNKKLDDATNIIGKDTPDPIIWYVHYHQWRILNNWKSIIFKIRSNKPNAEEPDHAEDRKTAKKDAEVALGMKISDLIQQQKEKIPETHPLRKMINYYEK